MEKTTEQPARRFDVMSIFVGTGLVAALVVPWYGLTYGYDTLLWALFIIFMFWNGLSITAGYHRLWAHKSYQAHFIVRLVFALGGALALQNSIKVWCSNHRNHHRYVDDELRDPYAPVKGLWFSHIGWMLRDYDASKLTEANITDLTADPLVAFQHKYYWLLAFTLNVLAPLGLGALAGDAIGGLLLLGFLRLVICHHTTFFINSLAHYWGDQPYSDENSARDNAYVAWLTYGEGYHNFHHTFQWDYRNGLRWYQFDPTKWLIGSLSLLRLTYALKRVAPEKIEASIVQMQLKQATTRILKFRDLNADEMLSRLDQEYDKLLVTLNAWASCRHEWLELKKANMTHKWQHNEVRLKLRQLEASLELQRFRWQMFTQQFA